MSVAVPSAAQRATGPRHFYLEEKFKYPVTIPSPVLRLLRLEAKRANCALDATTDISHWFSASNIDVGVGPRAIVVQSDQMCLNGVDHNWFWVFLKTGRRYQLVLHGGTLSVNVLKTRAHGLRGIETNVATANTNYTRIYKFNGSVYKPHKCLEAAATGQGFAKPRRVDCRTQ